MADRDSLLRDARRRQRALLAERTSPDSEGTPSLNAWFSPAPQSLGAAVNDFVPVLEALKGQNDYIHSWRIVRSPADHDAATGIDVIADPDGFIAYLREQNRKEDVSYSFDVLAFSSQIFPNDPRTYSAQIGYSGGLAARRSDRVTFGTTPQHSGDTLSFNQWAKMIETLVTWRETKYVSVGPYGYGIHNRVYDHRAWQGWMGWFPQHIDATTLPGFATVKSVGEGTLVASQNRTVRADDEAALQRAAQIEIALVELGILPTEAEIK